MSARGRVESALWQACLCLGIRAESRSLQVGRGLQLRVIEQHWPRRPHSLQWHKPSTNRQSDASLRTGQFARLHTQYFAIAEFHLNGCFTGVVSKVSPATIGPFEDTVKGCVGSHRQIHSAHFLQT